MTYWNIPIRETRVRVVQIEADTREEALRAYEAGEDLDPAFSEQNARIEKVERLFDPIPTHVPSCPQANDEHWLAVHAPRLDREMKATLEIFTETQA